MLRDLRKRLGMSQQQFSKLIGCSQQRVSEFELKKKRPTGCHRQLVQALNRLVDADIDLSFMVKK